MTKSIFTICTLAALMLIGCNNSNTNKVGDSVNAETPVIDAQQQVNPYKTIVDVSELHNVVTAEDANVQVIDVRTAEEFAEGHIAGAKNIPVTNEAFIDQMKQLSSEESIYVYCKSGGRSARAAMMCKVNGINNVYDVNGGITAWKASDYPVVK